MDYSIGSVAALISGNVTPNRPRLSKRALTPIKHQQSPNVTPKSELVDDRSIFLSPSLQKKKAIVKKSPKRIFQNPDLDVTNDSEGNSTLQSPKAKKVKKHLKDDLEADPIIKTSSISPKSQKKGKGKLNKSAESETAKKISKCNEDETTEVINTDLQSANESTPKKKKKRMNSIVQPVEEEKENITDQSIETEVIQKSPKSSIKKRKSQQPSTDNQSSNTVEDTVISKQKRKQKVSESEEKSVNQNVVQTQQSKKKKNKNKKKKSKQNQNKPTEAIEAENTNQESLKKNTKEKSQKNKEHPSVNPNAITNKDSDSEHDSDDEIESENEQINNQVLDTGPKESDSSDEEEEQKKTDTKKPEKERKLKERNIEKEIKRTLFVGNVPFSKKCKKEVRNIFLKHGPIDTVRIRTVPVKDARVTPKLAIIKNELHPERTTVNVYVKFKHPDSVEKALIENNTVLNDHHLRVSRSEVTGTEHDPRMAIFVGNLPFNIEDDVLRAKFEACGEIESVRVIRDRTTNAGKGFGYVNFASKDSVELALAMSEEDLTIKNRILRVKRCTMTMGKRDQGQSERPGKHRGPGRQEGPSGRQGPTGRFQGSQGRYQGPPGRNQGPPGRNQGPPGRNQGPPGRNQGQPWRNQGPPGRNQGQGRFQGSQGKPEGPNQVQDGAYRRIVKKRAQDEAAAGPPSKQPRPSEPAAHPAPPTPPAAREKKPRKEFVGMTAEKKKKRKFNKDQKKKKAISEILSKKQ